MKDSNEEKKYRSKIRCRWEACSRDPRERRSYSMAAVRWEVSVLSVFEPTVPVKRFDREHEGWAYSALKAWNLNN